MALATRCPFCETVFRLDPHLLAPHDGRVRCGHCQEVFDGAHYQFERDETLMAALAATAPNYEAQSRPEPAPSKAMPDHEALRQPATGGAVPDHDALKQPPTGTAAPDHDALNEPVPGEAAPNYGVDTTSPWSSPASAHVADGNRDALGISLHPYIPDAALRPPAAREPVSPPAYTARKEPSAESPAAETIPGTQAESDVLGQGLAESPWEAAPHAETSARVHQEASQEAPFDFRVDPRLEQNPNSRTDPFIGGIDNDRVTDARTEPFVSRTQAERRTTDRIEPASAPANPWIGNADPEPSFGTPSSVSDVALAPPEPDPFPVMRESRPPARSGSAWKIVGTLIALVLLVTLLAQLAWWQRETVMVYWPHSQSLFAQTCEQLGCVVAPPRDIDALQIENSGLRQVDGSHKLELKLSLHNRFDVTIAYPALELTLLDDKNNVAIRRVLWPQDYARPGTQLSAGLPPRSTQPVIVRLDTGEAVAANYRVQIFYP
ncbi:DUF3426 domain-containing protein [Caballeronia sp.]|uniref:DUF3426 domain-containing protein n=1 Tax=Caballeronia sp. TaxID=1931223 RepID=UPI003C59A521